MKILFNCSSNLIGGGVKNSAIFIKNVKDCSEFSWFFAISPPVKELLDKWGVKLSNVTVFSESPSKSIRSRWRLKKISLECKADLVYTMAGPSYVEFPVTHVQGVSNPHITHPNYNDLRSVISGKKFGAYLLRSAYQRVKSKTADYFIFQTSSSRDGFCMRTRVSPERCIVIGNAVDVQNFKVTEDCIDLGNDDALKILCPAAPYPHKALIFIPYYAKQMVLNGFSNFKFILTVAENHELYQKIAEAAFNLGVSDKIGTVGSYHYSAAPAIYSGSDFVFVPSLLETFSATYLESFAAHKPLIVADRQFAIDVCGNAAVYVEPLDPDDVAKKIISLINSPEIFPEMILQGKAILNSCETQKSRSRKICQFLSGVAGVNSNV